MLGGLRDHNLVMLTELERRGFVISSSTLRRLTDLLPTRHRVRRTAYLRRPYTEEEANWLEWLLILKSLGMTIHEVRAWLRQPNESTVRQRIEYVERIVKRAKELLTTGADPG